MGAVNSRKSPASPQLSDHHSGLSGPSSYPFIGTLYMRLSKSVILSASEESNSETLRFAQGDRLGCANLLWF